ncbi:Protein of unknown function [Halopseudomonas xinjiangensis]|uniref:DUF3325 domain-containing protein n=1 Tax=Halopseudomonas xinjiangensis TaxID=487184 RepID=A0A1H1XPE8_9GAMM|nr:DUF3325 domain-containing protein [Halopseudomonas xinjiangensis]SDT10941.1 Protein of unknown function [Halopseudomonas xinjiangensis]
MKFLLTLLIAYSGMLCFCLAMPRHWKQFGFSRYGEGWRHVCRPAGALLLILAVYLDSLIWPVGMAWVGWFGMMSLAGLTLALLAPYAPRLALWLPAGTLPLALWWVLS